jgi:hypothetical protein
MPNVPAHSGRVIAALAALGALILAAPSHAQGTSSGSTPGATPGAATQAATPSPSAPSRQVAAKAAPGKTASHADRVEGRITDLHAKFHITADQEQKWGEFASTMRDNAKRMDEVLAKRSQTVKGMTAVEDLRSYRDMTEVHYDNLKKLVSAFEPLYDTMSADQKKAADAVFAHAQSPQANARQGKVAKGS